jgi:predicted dehydrogenase
VLPAISASANSRLVSIAARDARRARVMAEQHGIERCVETYDALLQDPDVEAVYISLVNSLHREWTLRALGAGKHVLCEKPLAVNAAQAEEMAGAAEAAGRLLMEALMYRFHPRLRELAASVPDAHHVHAVFGFPLQAPGNYRLDPGLGGGALLDVGTYTVSAARWLLGEPQEVAAVAHRGASGVDMSVSVLLGFASGAQAMLHASFESPEVQELVVLTGDRVIRLEQPFTAWQDPADPYQLMVEAFAAAALAGGRAPLPPAESIANLRVLDRIAGLIR